MASDTEIANLALDKLGARSIDSLDADNDRARLVKRFFPLVRDRVLRSHNWNFAVTRVTLTADTATPDWEYDYQYSLPEGVNKCLRVIEVENEDFHEGTWKVEGRKIVTDKGGPIKIKYIKQVVNYGNWDGLAVEMFAAHLAADMAQSIGPSNTTQANLVQIARERTAEAKALDGQEGMPEVIVNDEWIDVRH